MRSPLPIHPCLEWVLVVIDPNPPPSLPYPPPPPRDSLCAESEPVRFSHLFHVQPPRPPRFPPCATFFGPCCAFLGLVEESTARWVDWLHNPCRLGGPRASQRGTKSEGARPDASHPGTKIRRGPSVGGLATSPLLSGGPHASQQGTKSEEAHNWADWLNNHVRVGDPRRFRAGGKIRIGPQLGGLATSPLPSWGPQRFTTGDKIRSGPQLGALATPPLPFGESPPFTARDKFRRGPQLGRLATSPLPSRGSPILRSGGQN